MQSGTEICGCFRLYVQCSQLSQELIHEIHQQLPFGTVMLIETADRHPCVSRDVSDQRLFISVLLEQKKSSSSDAPLPVEASLLFRFRRKILILKQIRSIHSSLGVEGLHPRARPRKKSTSIHQRRRRCPRACWGTPY